MQIGFLFDPLIIIIFLFGIISVGYYIISQLNRKTKQELEQKIHEVRNQIEIHNDLAKFAPTKKIRHDSDINIIFLQKRLGGFEKKLQKELKRIEGGNKS